MTTFKVLLIFVISVICLCEAKSKKNKQMVLRQKETNAINFIRIAVMRIIYGVASRLGFGEQISEALNGAFVPPGVDYDDYGGSDSIFGDDYDY